jgi:hypothetical protein
MVAQSKPYGVTKLRELVSELCQVSSNVKVREIALARSLANHQVPLLIFKQKTNGLVLSAFQKPIILLVSRTHPGHHTASHWIEAFLRCLSDRLLAFCDLHVIPMLDIDGVLQSNSGQTVTTEHIQTHYYEYIAYLRQNSRVPHCTVIEVV